MKPTRHTCYPFPAEVRRYEAQLVPATNLYRTAGAWLLEVELPGVAPSDIHVALEGNVIEVQAERNRSIRSAAGGVYVFEISRQFFRRRLELPHAIDAENVAIDCQDGIVSIEIRERDYERKETH